MGHGKFDLVKYFTNLSKKKSVTATYRTVDTV